MDSMQMCFERGGLRALFGTYCRGEGIDQVVFVGSDRRCVTDAREAGDKVSITGPSSR